MNIPESNRTVIILTVIFAIILLILIITYSLVTKSKKSSSPSVMPTLSINIPTITEVPEQSQEYKESTEKIAREQKEFLDHEAKVAQLLKLLPYQGNNFNLSYDYKKLEFILNIKQDKVTEANNEFNQFLLQNDIENRSWIRNLIILEQ